VDFTANITKKIESKTRKNDIVEYLDYHIPVTLLKGSKGNGDMQARLKCATYP